MTNGVGDDGGRTHHRDMNEIGRERGKSGGDAEYGPWSNIGAGTQGGGGTTESGVGDNNRAENGGAVCVRGRVTFRSEKRKADRKGERCRNAITNEIK